jgi:hypothetical protein
VITNEIPENGILLVFCSDYRGGKGNAVAKNFDTVREEFYKLSKFDFEIPICDLGDLISGKTLEDTHYILQEILSRNHKTKILCYAEEAKVMQMYLHGFEREDETELRSVHRELLCGIKYPEAPNINSENIDDWIKHLIGLDEHKYTRADEQRFEIVFEDESKAIERESKKVFVDGYEELYKEIKHLQKGDRVRIYHNPDKETLHDIIKMTDEKELFTTVDNFSSLWKNALRSYLSSKGFGYHFETLFEELKENGLSVDKPRLEYWLKEDCKTKFPMKKRFLIEINASMTISEFEIISRIFCVVSSISSFTI